MAEEKHEGEQFEYKAEMKQLLHLIIHSLYTHPEVFLRELISNSSDALNKVRFLQVTSSDVIDPDSELKITLAVDHDAKRFSIEDSGIGMTREDLVERIGTVASSGTLDFVSKVRDEKGTIDANDLIGKFGVGFYSVFMVADEVVLETRHASPGSVGLRWTSRGEGTFTIEEIDKKERGTRISFTLKDEHKDLSEEYRIKSIIRKYSNFVDFPIFLGKDKVNTVTALWQRSKENITEEERNEFYKFIATDFQDPLGHLHLNIEGRVNFKALVFIPSGAPMRYFDPNEEKSLQLYASRVFIQDDCKELVPDYLRFVRGVVDTEDLPLNVSREVTQSSPVTTKIREVITSKVLGLLEEWAQNEAGTYRTFWSAFGQYIKIGVNTDFTNREKLMDLMRFETTKTEGGSPTSFASYVEAMQENQKEIYYIIGESRDLVRKHPNLEYFRKHDIEVIYFTDPVDVFAIGGISEYKGKNLVSIEKADIDLGAETESDDLRLKGQEAKSILTRMKEILGDKVEDVVESKRLVDSVATLVVGKDGMDAQTERMMKMMDKNFSAAKKILEVNTAHPLLRNLAAINEHDMNDSRLHDAVLQIYQAALLIEDNLNDPSEFVKVMMDFMERATRA